jgi:hypothetical protein
MTNAGGIQRPQIPPRAGAQLSEAMVQSVNPSSVLRRWGIVRAIRTGGTVDVEVAGTTATAVRRQASYNPTLDERVFLDVVDTDMTVVGATAPATTFYRVAEVIAITGETVTVRWDDNGNNQTGVTRLSGSAHTVGEIVRVQTVGSTYRVVGIESEPVQYLRRPTGDIETTIRKTPKAGTLFLQGQSISRTAYKRLFDWAVAQGLFSETAGANLFGPGTTSGEFRLPDWRGRVLSGADTTNPLGKAFGATLDARSQTFSITGANLPNHTHTVSDHPGHTHGHALNTATAGSHDHPNVAVYSNGVGDHRAHNGGSWDWWVPLKGDGSQRKTPSLFNEPQGAHNHTLGGGDVQSGGGHTHTVGGTINATGIQAHTVQPSGGSDTPTAIKVPTDQPSYAVNYLIWI